MMPLNGWNGRDLNRNELYHYGMPRRSGRYPWGSGERPKQSLRRSRRDGIDKKSEKYEARKKEALTRGTATEILQFKGDLTTKEMQDAFNRINAERQLVDLSKKELDDGWNSINRVMKKVGNVTDWTKTSLEAYKMLQQVMNAVGKGGKKGNNSGGKGKSGGGKSR